MLRILGMTDHYVTVMVQTCVNSRERTQPLVSCSIRVLDWAGRAINMYRLDYVISTHIYSTTSFLLSSALRVSADAQT